eukprot:765091-Hanusia_phi.AAC.1
MGRGDLIVVDEEVSGSELLLDRLRGLRLSKTTSTPSMLGGRFSKKIEIDFLFETVQHVRFTLYDVDSPNKSLDQQDFLGFHETTLGKIVGSKGSCLMEPLASSKGASDKRYGTIKVLAEEVQGTNDALRFTLSGTKLATKDWLGKGDKYIRIKRKRKDGGLDVVYETEVIKNSKDPAWRAIELPLQKINLGQMDMPIVFELWDWNAMSSHDFMGQVVCTVQDLVKGTGPASFPFKKPKGNVQDTKDRGLLNITHVQLVHQPTFFEYVAGGCRINILVAVDFTASNEDPRKPDSLHYMNPSGLNQYQLAIASVGEILEKYNSSKQFGCYGFGAKLPDGRVSHCFALNGKADRPEVHGVQGILDAYAACLQTVTLYGPTNFADIITMANDKCKKTRPGSQEYYVLLIITDGEITDMDNTIEKIIDSCSSPLSIVIVGVGNADFGKMEELDGDDHVLRSSVSGRQVTRDIVQFVAFRECNKDGAELASRVLAEIPMQLTTYMISNNIQPCPRPSVDSDWNQ